MPTYGKTMTLAYDGEITVTHYRGVAAYNNGLRITLPVSQTVVSVASTTPAVYGPFGPYPAGTEVRVELFNNPVYDRDNTTVKARFEDGYQDGTEWQISWEDDFDDDYNDSFTNIVISSLPLPLFIRRPR